MWAIQKGEKRNGITCASIKVHLYVYNALNEKKKNCTSTIGKITTTQEECITRNSIGYEKMMRHQGIAQQEFLKMFVMHENSATFIWRLADHHTLPDYCQFIVNYSSHQICCPALRLKRLPTPVLSHRCCIDGGVHDLQSVVAACKTRRQHSLVKLVACFWLPSLVFQPRCNCFLKIH